MTSTKPPQINNNTARMTSATPIRDRVMEMSVLRLGENCMGGLSHDAVRVVQE